MALEIKIKFLLSSGYKDDCQGWSYGDNINLECSGWPVKKTNHLINSIFLHECFHCLFKKNKNNFAKFKRLINRNSQIIGKTLLKMWTPEVVFEEALVSSFLPEGYLSEKILNINSRKLARRELLKKKADTLSKMRNHCALMLYDLAKEYVIKKKKLDELYFKQTIKCVNNFLIKKG